MPLVIVAVVVASLFMGCAIEYLQMHRERVEAATRRRTNQAALHAASEAAVRRQAADPVENVTFVGATEVRQPASR